MQVGGHEIDIVLQGCPGKARVPRRPRLEQRRAAERPRANRAHRCGIARVAPQCCCRGCGRDLKPTDVTDLLLTHSHHDRSVNWTLFRHARILVGAHERAWSVNEP